MKVVLASSNEHKAAEIAVMMPNHIELLLQSALGVESPEETGSTFVENAIIKARHASAVTGLPAIADDSGICVPALGGDPGVRSARYAGEDASDTDNLQKLLDVIGTESDRRAIFHCVLVWLRTAGDPAPLIAEGSWQGEIAAAPSGKGGFGYDPVFFLPEMGCTASELSTAQKNAFSHRGVALRQLSALLQDQAATG
jgi:XTP/dITP diphosphohydrolase